MPRLMSVALTEEAVRDRRKTVTRRLGWKFLKPGDRLILCPQTRGVSREDRVDLAEVEVVDVRREPLRAIENYGSEECNREGFVGFSPEMFIQFFCSEVRGVGRDTPVTRIEWRYLE